MHKERVWQLVSKKIAQEATAEELVELEELLRQHPEMHYAIQHIQDLWKLQPLDAPETEDAFQKHLAKMSSQGIDVSPWQPAQIQPTPSAQPVRPLRRYVLAGLALAAIVTTVLFLVNREPGIIEKTPQLKNLSEISTRNGSRTIINLPDGSTVWLNAGSKLVYDKEFDSKLREVTLTGEAYFDVAKNEKKPFIIHAGKMEIRVLGTLFNVKSYPEEHVTEASLIRGSIEVLIKNRQSEIILLKPNEKIIVSDEPAPLIKGAKPTQQPEPTVAISPLSYEPKDSTIIETSWVENKLIFRDEAFKDLAVRLERWYGVLISFDNEKVQQIRFNGTFRNESIQQALAAMTIAAEFNYSINGNNIRIY